jgi:hypothetical protein
MHLRHHGERPCVTPLAKRVLKDVTDRRALSRPRLVLLLQPGPPRVVRGAVGQARRERGVRDPPAPDRRACCRARPERRHADCDGRARRAREPQAPEQAYLVSYRTILAVDSDHTQRRMPFILLWTLIPDCLVCHAFVRHGFGRQIPCVICYISHVFMEYTRLQHHSSEISSLSEADAWHTRRLCSTSPSGKGSREDVARRSRQGRTQEVSKPPSIITVSITLCHPGYIISE